jgi:EmrB/QacA subfamily drug resistance transporter
MLLTVLLAALDQTIVGTAMPRIVAQLHGFERYAWVTAAYLVGSTAALPIFTRLSDFYGRKRLLIGGVLLFIGSSALCGSAGRLEWLPLDGMNQLIAFRALQGVGGGMVTGLIFTLIGDIFSASERGKYQGLFSATIGLASIVGPIVGGWITDHLSWRWTFYVNLPVGLFAVAVLVRGLRDSAPRSVHSRTVDWPGVALLCAWLVPLLAAVTLLGQSGSPLSFVVALLVLAGVFIFAFLAVEARAPNPLMPLVLFRDPIILISSLQMLLFGAALMGVVIYLPLFVQAVLGTSATRSGSVLMPLMLASVVMSAVCGQVIARTGRYRSVAIAGSVLMFAGVLLLSAMDARTSLSVVIGNSILVGSGFGLIQPLYVLAVQHVAPRGQMGAATASAMFSRSIGSAVGVAVFGSVMLVVYHAQLGALLPAEAADYAGNPMRLLNAPPAVRDSLADALRVVFAVDAALLALSIVLNAFLRSPEAAVQARSER